MLKEDRFPVRGICAGFWFLRGLCAGAGKKKITIAVGGKNLFYYLPLTIAERAGYFKDEGLDVEIVDFPGGAKRCRRWSAAARTWSPAPTSTPSTCRPRASDRGGRAAGALLRHRARRAQGQGGAVQVAEGPEGLEDRRHRAGFVHQHDGQQPAGEGRAQAGRCLDHRRGRHRRRGGGDAQGRDRRDVQPRSGDQPARDRRRHRGDGRHAAPPRA